MSAEYIERIRILQDYKSTTDVASEVNHVNNWIEGLKRMIGDFENGNAVGEQALDSLSYNKKSDAPQHPDIITQ